MDKASEERSPKRQAYSSTTKPGVPAASAVAALDDAIWTSIVEFMPIPRALEPSDKEKHEAAVAEVVATWQTLLHLRLVSKKLAVLLHPRESAALWRRLVLQSFDFSTHHRFNVENGQDDHGLDVPSDEEESEEDEEEDGDEEDGDEEQAKAEDEMEVDTEEPNGVPPDSEENEENAEGETHDNPQLVAMRGRYRDMPSEYLEEDLVSWAALGIYHRPSQYGFLTTLQQQHSQGEWPEYEDAFTLFGDLVRLLQLPPGKQMNVGGEGGEETFKYLGAPAEADSSSPFHRFFVMKTLGYVPHFWHWGCGIGKEWKGVTEPDAFEKAVAGHVIDEYYGDDVSFEKRSTFGFPCCTLRNAKRLYCHIRQHCRDWRSVCCNNGYDGTTPVFFVGESKAAPHRWTGYMGAKTWT